MTARSKLPARLPGLGRVKTRVDSAIRWRAAETVEPVARRAQDLHDWVARVEASVDPVARRAQDLHDWVARVEANAEWSANELRRLAPQVAAIEVRLAELDDRLRADVSVAAPADRSALDAIAAEHERVRVRLAAVANYEERLRRLEDQSDTAATTSS